MNNNMNDIRTLTSLPRRSPEQENEMKPGCLAVSKAAGFLHDLILVYQG